MMKGWKTWVGTIGYALCHGLAMQFPDYASWLTGFADYLFLPLGVIGIGHKLDKASPT